MLFESVADQGEEEGRVQTIHFFYFTQLGLTTVVYTRGMWLLYTVISPTALCGVCCGPCGLRTGALHPTQLAVVYSLCLLPLGLA